MRASIVMATFNGEAFLHCQIESIIKAMDSDDELIVVDDGSTDSTMAILCSYASKDQRIKILPDCSHKGIVKNFSYGIGEATGDIIFLADQDDIWDENKIKRIKYLFTRDPELTCVLSDLSIIDQNGVEVSSSFFKLRGVQKGFSTNLIKNSYIGNAMAFRSSMKKIILPIPTNVPMHDQWIGLLNEKYGKTLFLNEVLGSYRRHGNNVTQMKHGSIISMLCKRFRLLVELIKRNIVTLHN